MHIEHPSDNRVPDQIKNLISMIHPTNLIITGGEPLMVKASYYYDLYEYAGVPISATTNLKDFYEHPGKWTKLFREPWFNVTTSFQYGESRRWSKDEVFTEERFREVYQMYQDITGKKISSFIAVISDENESLAMKHIDLARDLGCQVRMNNAWGVGLQGTTYQRYRIFKIYLDIIHQDLDKYELNCSERRISRCPRNVALMCNSTIRCCYVDLDHKLHVSTCDEQLSIANDLPFDRYASEPVPNKIPYEDFITPECAYCELCRLCNGCDTNRQEAKKDPNYCAEMKKLEDQIIETGWLL
jgi:hypothetical protein